MKNYMKLEFSEQPIFLVEEIVFELALLGKECVNLRQQRSKS